MQESVNFKKGSSIQLNDQLWRVLFFVILNKKGVGKCKKKYSFQSKIYASEIGKGGAYIIFPYDLREEFGVGRVKVQATFDGVAYEGSIVNMGVKNEDGTICYILGIRKDIRKKIEKDIGDIVSVEVIPKN